LGERSPENVVGWESILAEIEIGKTTLVAFRLENELLKRIDILERVLLLHRGSACGRRLSL